MSMLLKPLRSFVPLSVKEFLYSLKERKATVVTLEGFKLAIHQHDTIISESIRQNKIWAQSETRLFRELLKPGMVVVDVGANIGYFSLLASTLVGPNGRVHAFEPDPVNCGLLRKNVRMNHTSNIKVVQAALSSNDEPIHLFLNSDNKGDHRIWEQSGESRTKITVTATTLDQYLKETATVPNFIKIDVQGAEGYVIEGMADTIVQNGMKYLILEFWPEAMRKCQTDPKQVVQQISDAGFTIRVIADDILLGENVIVKESFESANAQTLIDLADAAPYQQIDLICTRL
jgi:FkbM family methyltransferase